MMMNKFEEYEIYRERYIQYLNTINKFEYRKCLNMSNDKTSQMVLKITHPTLKLNLIKSKEIDDIVIYVDDKPIFEFYHYNRIRNRGGIYFNRNNSTNHKEFRDIWKLVENKENYIRWKDEDNLAALVEDIFEKMFDVKTIRLTVPWFEIYH